MLHHYHTGTLVRFFCLVVLSSDQKYDLPSAQLCTLCLHLSFDVAHALQTPARHLLGTYHGNISCKQLTLMVVVVVVVIRNECLLSVIVLVCRAQLLNFWSNKVMLPVW